MQSGALQAYIFIHSFIFINFDSCYPSNYLAGKWSSRLSYFSSDNSQSTRINRSQLLGQNCAAGSTRKQEKKGSKYLCRPLAMSSEYDINSLCEHLNCMRTWAPENAKSLNCNVLEKYSNAQYAKTHHGLSLCYMLSCERERERGRTLLSHLTAHCYAHVNSSRCYSKCNKSGLLARRRFQFDSNSQRDGYTARSSLSRLTKYYLLALQIGGEFEISYRVVSQK